MDLERSSFLEWRRALVELEDVEGITLTPYERNLEFWRQLWRVIERRLVGKFFIRSLKPSFVGLRIFLFVTYVLYDHGFDVQLD